MDLINYIDLELDNINFNVSDVSTKKNIHQTSCLLYFVLISRNLSTDLLMTDILVRSELNFIILEDFIHLNHALVFFKYEFHSNCENIDGSGVVEIMPKSSVVFPSP